MILAYHLVWTAYGWWFPNDPRGSWSHETWSPCLATLPATGENRARGRRPVQPTPVQLRDWLATAQSRLKYRPVLLDSEAQNVARNAIVGLTSQHRYEILALAVKQEHVHIVLRRHEHRYQRMVRALKAVSSRELRKYLGLVASPEKSKRAPVWSRGYWVRYLDTEKAIAPAITYVDRQACLPC